MVNNCEDDDDDHHHHHDDIVTGILSFPRLKASLFFTWILLFHRLLWAEFWPFLSKEIKWLIFPNDWSPDFLLVISRAILLSFCRAIKCTYWLRFSENCNLHLMHNSLMCNRYFIGATFFPGDHVEGRYTGAVHSSAFPFMGVSARERQCELV